MAGGWGTACGSWRGCWGTQTRDEWFDRLGAADCCLGEVLGYEELHCDPQLVERQSLIRIRAGKGRAVQTGLAIKLSGTPARVRRAAPKRYQHTTQVLKKLGYSANGIATLRRSGSIA